MNTQQVKIELEAQPRTIMKKKVRRLRKVGFLPAVLYGKGRASLPIQVKIKDFEKVYKLAGESTLVYLNLGNQGSYPTIIHEVVLNSLKDDLMHADFYKVSLTEKIKTKVPVVFTGESPAVKDLGGIFVRNINELEVEALPQNLPHEITIDISKLGQIGDQILVSNINLGKDVTIIADSNEIIALIQEPISEEELKKQLEGEVKAADEVEVIGKEEKAEEEVAEEGEAETVPTAEKKE